MEHRTDPERRSSVTPSSPRRRFLRPLLALAVAAGLAVPAAALTLGRDAGSATAVGRDTILGPAPTDQQLSIGQVDYAGGHAFLTGAPKNTASCNTDASAPAPAPTGGTFGRAKLASDQVQTAATVISVGKAMKISRRGIRIALLVAMNESSLDPFAKDKLYVGLFQQPAKGYTQYDRADAIGATRMFFKALVSKAPKYTKDARPDWALAELVQGKGKALTYNGWRTTADALVTTLYVKTPKYDFQPVEDTCPQDGESTTGVPDTFDPGYLISDEVFYDATAMSLKQIRAFIRAEGASCEGTWCLRNLVMKVPTIEKNSYCLKIPGGTDDAAEVIWKVSLACHVNPQVMLVTLEKESGLLTDTEVGKSDYAAAWGWHCPDTGPGGTAHCDPQHAGFFNQAVGMAKQWSRFVMDPQKYHYHAGDTANVLYNVKESGCGGAEVHIRNKATASLYNYTPYQPNAASLAAYPGVGDSCSSYGNRNFYFLFAHYFGTISVPQVAVQGTSVQIPRNAFVPEALAGKTITAPSAAMAKGLAAGFAALGTPYVWGGGTNGGAADEGCARGGGAKNSCQGQVGFDCSGLTGYVLRQAGFAIGTDSATQRSGGQDVAWKDGRPGDIIGYDGHVAIYLGIFDGVPYMLEAPNVGKSVRIRDVRGGADGHLHRYWG